MYLYFSKPYHPEVLGAFYTPVDGVLYAGPPGVWCPAWGICGGDSIQARPPRYTFNHCSGWWVGSCVSRHSWTFRVDGESAVLEGESDSLPEPALLVGANGGLIDGEFTGGFPSGDGVPGGDFVYRFRWDSTGVEFLRGDCNDDGEVDISDASYTFNWLFTGGPPPGCLASANTNGDDSVDLSDPVYLLNFLFLGGPSPIAPFPDRGTSDLAADAELGCEETACP